MDSLEKRVKRKFGQFPEKLRSVVEFSIIVDFTDQFLGPGEALATAAGYPGIDALLTVIEYSLKVPFVFYYLSQTKDFKSLWGWGFRETLAYIIPFGDLFLDISPSYENRLLKYIRKS